MAARVSVDDDSRYPDIHEVGVVISSDILTLGSWRHQRLGLLMPWNSFSAFVGAQCLDTQGM